MTTTLPIPSTMSSTPAAAAAVTLAGPVGALVTADGRTFTVEPVHPTVQPYRVRCGHCPWQATTDDLAQAVEAAGRHDIAHQYHDQRRARPPGLARVWSRLAGGAR